MGGRRGGGRGKGQQARDQIEDLGFRISEKNSSILGSILESPF